MPIVTSCNLHGRFLGVVSVEETCTAVASNTKLKDRGVDTGLDIPATTDVQSQTAVERPDTANTCSKNATEVNRDGLVDVIQYYFLKRCNHRDANIICFKEMQPQRCNYGL